ncbi:MAG: MotA/TolQ/ExbB proton channel family protein [Aquisalinus sp.]|nr:MotA/TolQ/ExbB proton channel family protein [Aquisalinus sp.]
MNSLKTQSTRIFVILAILIAMSIWQFDFIMGGVEANPPLNFTIFGTFIFGVVLVAQAQLTLRNEYHAFYALVEMYDDTRQAEQNPDVAYVMKFERCRQLGIVYKKPVILGQSYQLLSEQLLRDKELQISASTMQTLLSGIDERLNDVRALIGYISGILVFLGLIGTFVGLMVTLASVGDILGGLDLTAGDPTAVVAGLMTSLQKPLGGMATGFSSSLFGLVTSLTLSLMLQLSVKAGGALKSDFSDWLSNAVEIHEGMDRIENAGSHPAQIEERRLALLMRTARHCVDMTNAHSRAIRELTRTVDKLVLETSESRQISSNIAGSVKTLSDQNKIVHKALTRSIEAFHRVSHTTDLRDELTELTALINAEQSEREEQNSKILRLVYKKINTPDPVPETTALEEQGGSLSKELKEDSEELNIKQLKSMLGALYRSQKKSVGAETVSPQQHSNQAVAAGSKG